MEWSEKHYAILCLNNESGSVRSRLDACVTASGRRLSAL